MAKIQFLTGWGRSCFVQLWRWPCGHAMDSHGPDGFWDGILRHLCRAPSVHYSSLWTCPFRTPKMRHSEPCSESFCCSLLVFAIWIQLNASRKGCCSHWEWATNQWSLVIVVSISYWRLCVYKWPWNAHVHTELAMMLEGPLASCTLCGSSVHGLQVYLTNVCSTSCISHVALTASVMSCSSLSLPRKKPSLEKSFLPLLCMPCSPPACQHTVISSLPHALLPITRWPLLALRIGQERARFMKHFHRGHGSLNCIVNTWHPRAESQNEMNGRASLFVF